MHLPIHHVRLIYAAVSLLCSERISHLLYSEPVVNWLDACLL